MDFQDFQAWLLQRCVDCNELTAELQTALQSQYESEQLQRKPVTETIVLSDDWPRRVHRVTQKMLFDVSELYR